MDTLGHEKQFVVQRFPLFRGCFICTTFYADPQKQSVIERFPLLGEFIAGDSVVPNVFLCIQGWSHQSWECVSG